MRSSWKWLLVGVLLAAGCAQDVGDIDRTQPNKVKKSIFQPVKGADGQMHDRVWLYRPTITDVPLATGFSFIGEQGDTEKVVWDVQEDMLVAYRSYEFIKGSEEYASRPGIKYRGAPVAAFPISSHFDIKREYNPATGEQTNVLTENSSDRPWYEREYMRVDWGDNKIADFKFATSQVKQQAAYYVQPNDGDSKDRPVITENYIDITTKLFAEPETVYFEGYGTFPQCYLWSHVTDDCLGQAVKVRNSFMLVEDDSETFEPLPYDEKMQMKFGFFKTNRYAYDRERDLLEAETDQFAERFNIWARAFRRDAAGNKVRIPESERGLRPIIYYTNDQFPHEDAGDTVGLINEAQMVQDEWNTAFIDSVKPLKPNQEIKRISFLCRNNPVTDSGNLSEELTDADLEQFKDPDTGKLAVPFPDEKTPEHKICGPTGLNPQIGDLRYSFQYWVVNPNQAGLLGYGPHAPDPENGHVHSANAFIYGSPMETYATYVADTVSLMIDDTKESDLQDASYLKSLLAERLGKVPDVFRSVDAIKQDMQKRHIDLRASQIAKAVKKGEMRNDYARANLEALRGGWASQYLITDEVVKAFGNGVQVGDKMDEATLNRLNPSTWGHRSFLSYEKERLNRLSSNDITAADFYDDAIAARAIKMAYHYGWDPKNPTKTYTDAEKRARFTNIRRDLLKELYVAVTLHEVGHTFGLRHNFAASSDALNYQTDALPHLDYLRDAFTNDKGANNYWYVRAKVQEKTLNPGLAGKIQPAYLAAFDKDAMERYPMKELEYSSIMDYSAKPNGDMFGIGKYDRAAIRFGYGQLVDVFDPATAGTAYASTKLPDDLELRLRPGDRHYTALPYLFAGTTGIPTSADYDKGVAIMIKGRKTIPYAQELADVAAGKKVHEVPYRFCSDEYVGGTSTCYRFDEGPDMYEQTQTIREMYENLYWFNNFKRGRVNFALGGSANGYLGRIYGRYFDILSNQYKHFVNDELVRRRGGTLESGAQCPDNLGSTNLTDHYASPVCGLDQYASAIESLNFFAHVLATPDVGTYGLNSATGEYEMDHDSTEGGTKPEDKIKLDVGQAKFALSAYSQDRYGYSFFYKPVRMGAWWDKYAAVLALGDPYTNFMGVDSTSDLLNYLINFNDLFGSDIQNMVGGLSIEKYDAYAPRVQVDTSGKATGIVYKKPANLFQDNTDYTKLKPLNPNETYTVRLISTYLGIAYFSGEKSDTQFINSIKINVAGLGETPAVPASVNKADPDQYVELEDPNSHKIYWATRYDYYGYDGSVDKDVVPLGFSLLKKAKENAKNGADVRSELHFIDIVRGMLHEYEFVRGL